MTSRLRGRIPLRLALLFGVLGLVAIGVGSVVLARGAFGNVDSFARVPLDGSPHAVHLTRTGEYVGYYETPRLDTSEPVPSVSVSITGTSGALHVGAYDKRTRLTYDLYGHHGIAVVTFCVPQPGRYTVSGRSSGATLALGESIAGNAVTGVAFVLPGVVIVIVAIVLLVVGLTRRRVHKRQRDEFDRTGYSPR